MPVQSLFFSQWRVFSGESWGDGSPLGCDLPAAVGFPLSRLSLAVLLPVIMERLERLHLMKVGHSPCYSPTLPPHAEIGPPVLPRSHHPILLKQSLCQPLSASVSDMRTGFLTLSAGSQENTFPLQGGQSQPLASSGGVGAGCALQQLSPSWAAFSVFFFLFFEQKVKVMHAPLQVLLCGCL